MQLKFFPHAMTFIYLLRVLHVYDVFAHAEKFPDCLVVSIVD